MLVNLHRNCMGTISFDAKFSGMRKPQDFIIYPMKDDATVARIQSGTRIGTIDMKSGEVRLSAAHARGAYFAHLAEAVPAGKLSADELFALKLRIFTSVGHEVGTNGIVYTDNSAAAQVFGQ